MKRQMVSGMVLVILISAHASHAAGLGIPLDGFLTQVQTWVIGLGLIMGLIGLTRAGLLGGGTVLLGLMGLVGGATL